MQHTIFVSIQIYNYTIADMCIRMYRMIEIEYTLHARNTYKISGLKHFPGHKFSYNALLYHYHL